MQERKVITRQPRVLLVEDEQAVGDAIADCLEQLGCEVASSSDLGSATARARNPEDIFDVAIVDIELPDGNGLELVEALRSRAQPCVTLVLTGHEEVEWARKAAALGVAGFLRKPVSARKLSSAVAKAIERSREMREWLQPREGGSSDYGEDAKIVAEALVADLGGPRSRPVRTAKEQVRALSLEFGLTARQTEALERVSEGHRDRQIAEDMGVSYSRVRQLLAAGFGKLGVKSRNDFIRFLVERQGSM
ncbi:response regulator transcription factor [Plesiocystis pacifica]|uniref:response regulator transcription factor n=1 Tax=Plesiocystis pacifica TaxID=191768 RepID=UPI0018DD1F11|nr:response regulator transcription factor [Plesiocystis pacifica]